MKKKDNICKGCIHREWLRRNGKSVWFCVKNFEWNDGKGSCSEFKPKTKKQANKIASKM